MIACPPVCLRGIRTQGRPLSGRRGTRCASRILDFEFLSGTLWACNQWRLSAAGSAVSNMHEHPKRRPAMSNSDGFSLLLPACGEKVGMRGRCRLPETLGAQSWRSDSLKRLLTLASLDLSPRGGERRRIKSKEAERRQTQCFMFRTSGCGSRHESAGLRRPSAAGALACRRSTTVLA